MAARPAQKTRRGVVGREATRRLKQHRAFIPHLQGGDEPPQGALAPRLGLNGPHSNPRQTPHTTSERFDFAGQANSARCVVVSERQLTMAAVAKFRGTHLAIRFFGGFGTKSSSKAHLFAVVSLARETPFVTGSCFRTWQVARTHPPAKLVSNVSERCDEAKSPIPGKVCDTASPQAITARRIFRRGPVAIRLNSRRPVARQLLFKGFVA